MGINYPGGVDSFGVPTDPEDTPLSEAGSTNRNHVQWHEDAGSAIVALESNAAQLNHDHSGSIAIGLTVEQLAAGTGTLDDIQLVTLTGTPTAGSYTLSISDSQTIGTETTTGIAWNATAATVQSALTTLLGVGNVTVSGSTGGPYTVTFIGALANTPQPTMGVTASVTGGGVNITHTTVGSPGGGSVQTIIPSNTPTGGSFQLTFNGHTTSSIAWNAAGVDVATALEALSSVGSGNVSVTGTGPWTVTFTGSLGTANQPLISALSSLTSGLFATGQLKQINTHQNPDTDSSTTAIHHTIGLGGNQAAPGNHTHDYNGSTILNKPYIICTSTTRPINPEIGEIIWETDTSRARVWSSFPGNVLETGASFTDIFNRISTIVSFDAQGPGASATNATSVVATHTVGGSATALIVAVTNYSSAAPWHQGWTNTVNCGTTPMVQLGVMDCLLSLTGYVALFGLLNPPTGTQTLNVNVSNGGHTGDLVVESASYVNVGAFGAPVLNAGALGFPFPVVVPSSPGDMVVGAFCSGQGVLSAPTGGTQRGYSYPGAPSNGLMIVDSPGSTTLSGTTLGITSTGLTNASIGVNLVVASSNLGNNYSPYYVTGNAADGTMAVSASGSAAWIVGQNQTARIIAKCIASGATTTLSDNQDLSFTTGTTMGVSILGQPSPTVDAYLRMSSDGQTYVRLALNNAQAQFFYTSSGPAGEKSLGSASAGTLSTNMQWEVKLNGNVFTLYRGGVSILSATDSSNLSAIGASYRGWGIGMTATQGSQYQLSPSTITQLVMNDLPIYGSETIWQLLNLGSVPYVRGETHVGQSIAVNNQVSAFWDTVLEDIFGFFGYNQIGTQTTIPQTTGITITEAGHYDVHASVPWDPTFDAFDHAMIGFTVNGQDIGRRNWTFMRGNGYAPGFAQTNEIFMHWHFAAGDVLRVVIAHNASSTQWLFYNPSSPNIQVCQIDLKFTGP